MADASIAAALIDRAGSDWSIFVDIHGMEESQRRDLLRFHRESSITSQRQVGLRKRLDDALDRVALLELGLDTGVLTTEDAGIAAIPGLKALLAGSPAFVRYTDNYLSLGLRFVADRLQVPLPLPGGELNELPVPRPCPPAVDTAICQSWAAMARFLAIEPSDADPDIRTAMDFLDDFALAGVVDGSSPHLQQTVSGQQRRFELWVRGLTGTTGGEAALTAIARGIAAYAVRKATFYRDVEFTRIGAHHAVARRRGAFRAENPITARFGLFDLYWIARILRADVSPNGAVTYANGSWLELLAKRTAELGLTADAATLGQSEEVLRGVLDYTCDLVQNAVDIVNANLDATVARGRTDPPLTTWGWRDVFDEEQEEVHRHREERLGRPVPDAEGNADATLCRTRAEQESAGDADGEGPGGVGWSRRIRTGEHEHELVGLAISGGGIRSATFALGILQHLQQIDLLRKVDYLSTVSGGGYIGSWLVGNVLRNRYWLTQPTDWSRSIAHLRRYSNYLAPRTGLLSADSWAMWGSWLRNTLLIQLGATAWLGLVMALATLGGLAFAESPGISLTRLDAVIVQTEGWGAFLTYRRLLGALLAAGMLYATWRVDGNLRHQEPSRSEAAVQKWIVVPALIVALLAAALMWSDLPRGVIGNPPDYGAVLVDGIRRWWIPLGVLFLSFLRLSLTPLEGLAGLRRWSLAGSAALVATVATHLVAATAWWWYHHRDVWGVTPWHAYAFGPSLLLLAATVGVALMIGVVGADAADWRREWWTRLGSWLGIYAAGALVIPCATVFGPWLLLTGIDKADTVPITTWGAVLTWVGTVVGGLLAGNSSRSDGAAASSVTAKALAVFARFAAIAFIAGALCLVATALHAILFALSTSDDLAGGQRYFAHLASLDVRMVVVSTGLLAVFGLLSSYRFDLNTFGLNEFYRNRLVRCYLGATRWQPGKRQPHRFTAFDKDDDPWLYDLRHDARTPLPYRGPFPIVNAALNLGGSSDLDLHTRHSASFVMTPLRCGADRPTVGYAPTEREGRRFADGVTLGQAVSISGAAASPNMGYDTSPLVSFLLTMFNVRLGWWFPNPGQDGWDAQRLTTGILRLCAETFGMATETSRFVNVSDGGHFENLGIYELVRRRCTVIIASDGECDSELAFGSLGRVIRMCRTDFGAHIDIDVESIRRSPDTKSSRAHCAVGRITYANGSRGYLVYLKSSLTGDEDVDVQQYHASHPDFPHESTGDQFFSEDQSESYRKLGQHVASVAFRGAEDAPNVVAMAQKLSHIWVADVAQGSTFLDRTQALVDLWDRMRETRGLEYLFRQLHGLEPMSDVDANRSVDQEQIVCLELIQLMENTYVGLRLDEHWAHPDNRGWVELFTMWARSDVFRGVWRTHHKLFGIRFAYFCRERLGLA